MRASFYFDFQEYSPHPTPTPISEARVLCTRLRLEFSLAGIVTSVRSILILIAHSNVFYSFSVWDAVRSESSVRSGAGSQLKGVGMRSALSMVGR